MEARNDGIALVELFAPYFEGETCEWFIAAGLDDKARLVELTAARDRPDSNRFVISCMRRVLRHLDVSIVVVAHNHPTGPALPSQEDLIATRQLAALCRLAHARLIDHLIYAPQGTISLRAMGVLC